MRIALISSWNACCGVATHAELVFEALKGKGHLLRVLAPVSYEDDATKRIHAPDDPCVTKCYSFLRYGDRCTDVELQGNLYFDTRPLLETGFDLIIVEKPTSVPLKPLMEALPRLKEKSRLVAIIHEGTAPKNPYLRRVHWDAAAIFDERYRVLVRGVIPDDRIHVVPFPCHPVDQRSQGQARDHLGIPRDADVVFSYGGLEGYEPVIEAAEGVGEERGALVYLLLVGDTRAYTELKRRLKQDTVCRALFGRPPSSVLYDYLCASDAIILHKGKPSHVAVSSSAHLCMGSLTPIVCSDTPYFEGHRGEVVKYRDMGELQERLIKVLEGKTPQVTVKARKYVETNMADKAAQRILDLAAEA